MLTSKGNSQPMLLAGLLGIGFAFIWCVLFVLLASVTYGSSGVQSWERLRFQLDGTPVIQSERGFHDMAGNAVDANDPKTFLMEAYLHAGADQSANALRATWDQCLRSFADQSQPPTIWYFIANGQSHGSAYLVGYSVESNLRIGFIGTSGFRADEPPPQERFPFDGGVNFGRYHAGIGQKVLSPQQPYGVQAGRPLPNMFDSQSRPGVRELVFIQADDDKIYQIDLTRRIVNVVLENERIVSMQWIHEPAVYPKPAGLAVRTTDAVLMLNERLERTNRFVLPLKLRDKAINWFQTSSGTAVAWLTNAGLGQAAAEQEVYWLNAAGQVIRHEVFTLPGQSPPKHLQILIAAALPAPLLLSVAEGVLWPLELFSQGRRGGWWEAWTQTLESCWPSLVLACLVAAVFAALCYRREARYGATSAERFLWTLFVFAFGFFGWIGYRFARSWPTLIRCPACKVAVPSDRGACAACHADFPQPMPKGTEVFA